MTFGANSDIASLSGLTTALSTGQGGTGNNTGAADSLTVGGTALSTVIAGLPTLAGANTFSGAIKFTSTTLPSAAAGALALGGQLSALSSLSANGEGQAYLLSAYGLVLQGDGSTYDIALVARNNTLALGVTTGTGNVVVGNQITARTFQSSGPNIVLSGSTVPIKIGAFGGSLSGTSTINGNTWGSYVGVLSTGDNANLAGSFDNVYAGGSYGGTSFAGGRGGVHVTMNLNTASTLSSTSDGLTGIASKVTASVSGGGSASGNLGSLFGSNAWCDLQTGATYYTQCVGEEVDGAVQSGASVGNFAVEQFVLTSDHATHGTSVDAMVRIAAQVGASAGVRDLMLFGDAFSQWPVDPNGYLIETQLSGNNLTVPATAAGGIDLLQATFSGSGATGGGFAFRSTGMQVDQNGRVQSGFGLLDGTSGGLTVNTTEQKMTSAAVSAGGSNFTSNDIVTDAYGNVLRVTGVNSGAVTTLSLVKSGYSTSPPSNPGAFTAQTKNGSSIGSGLTVTETWTGASTLTLAANGSGAVALGSGSDALQLIGSGMFTANGSTSACVGSLGPSGVHSTVQEWLTVKDSAGTVRYIPAC